MTIPAQQIVNINPSVLSAGGTAILLVGLMLTQNTRVPIGSIQTYLSSQAVSSALGASSTDAAAAAIYFNGFTGATLRPGRILVAQYNTVAVAAYLRSASLAGVSLASLQGLNGPLTVTMDGYPRTATLNLSTAVSFSSAASIIQTGLNTGLPVEATATASIAGGTLTVTGTLTGTLSVGQTVTGSNTPASTIITGQLTGALNGTGTYSLSTSGTVVTSQTLTMTATALTVTFDSVTNAFVITSGITGTPSTSAFATGSLSTPLLLTSATNAVLSQGAVPATPATFMANIIRLTQNWATFFANFDPDGGVGNATKLAFAQWTNTTNNRYAYIAGDTDTSPTLSATATSSLGQLIATNTYGGTTVIYDPTIYTIPSFISGSAASINFNALGGRITFAFKGQAGLIPAVTDGVTAQNLLANFYNFYGAYATATTTFQFFQNGSISGPYLWLDSYLNQIWLNATLQQSILTYMSQVNAITYNPAGFGALENSMAGTIQQGLTFGAYSPNVQITPSQAAQVNAVAGGNISGTLVSQGWYLLIQDPGPVARQNRQSPICNFWYVDGESVQQINLNSIAA